MLDRLKQDSRPVQTPRSHSGTRAPALHHSAPVDAVSGIAMHLLCEMRLSSEAEALEQIAWALETKALQIGKEHSGARLWLVPGYLKTVETLRDLARQTKDAAS